MNKERNKFYFTFGSDSGFPYQNTYLIVIANTESEAIMKFRSKYPDRSKNCVNCSFWYTEKQWESARMFSRPVEIIEQDGAADVGKIKVSQKGI